jgi:hypothetical protein
MAGDSLDFGVVEPVDHYFVIGPKPAKFRADRPGCTAFGAAEDSPSEDQNDQKYPCACNNSDFFHNELPIFQPSSTRGILKPQFFSLLLLYILTQSMGTKLILKIRVSDMTFYLVIERKVHNSFSQR